ncbi:MAG: hypothetical protein HEEMFOPI_01857 [Holosporales bacterium]
MKHLFLSMYLIAGVLTNLSASEEGLALLPNSPTHDSNVHYTTPKKPEQTADAQEESLTHLETVILLQPTREQTDNELLEKIVKLLAEKGLSIVPIRPLNQESGDITPQNLYNKLQNAFSGLDVPSVALSLNHDLIFNFEKLLTSSLLPLSEVDIIKNRINTAESIIRSYFDSVIDYKKWTFQQLKTIPILTTLIFCLSLNAYVFYKYYYSDGKFYPAISPMAGGTLVLTINTLTSNLALKMASKSPPMLAHQKWKEKLSNPKVKFYISKLIALIFVFNNDDKSPEYIRNKLEKTLSDGEIDDYTSLFNILFPIKLTTDLRIDN